MATTSLDYIETVLTNALTDIQNLNSALSVAQTEAALVPGLQTQVTTLTTQNATLTSQNASLTATNASQATQIAASTALINSYLALAQTLNAALPTSLQASSSLPA